MWEMSFILKDIGNVRKSPGGKTNILAKIKPKPIRLCPWWGGIYNCGEYIRRSTFVLFLIFFTSCSFIKNGGSTSATRPGLLNQRLSAYNKALYWGAHQETLLFVTPEYKAEYAKKLSGETKNKKLVDLEISNVKFEEEATKAYVDIVVRFYEIPSYVVRTKRESQTWEFRGMEGWLQSKHETTDDGLLGSPEPYDGTKILRGSMSR